MPKGVAKNGQRRKRRTKAEMMAAGKVYGNNKPIKLKKLEKLAQQPERKKNNETEHQTRARISERFDILNVLAEATVTGESRALIVSGPAGLGKSYTVEECLKKWDPNGINHTIIKGYVKATGLYKTLWQYKNRGQVIVFDDADSIFFDDVSLNMLKAVCDTNDIRRVSYLSEGVLIDEENAERLDKSFEFHGAIIFITNLDFDNLIARGHKLAPHLQALISRAHYIDLSLKTTNDYIVRIKQVVEEGLLDRFGLFSAEQKEVVNFVVDNADEMRELSLRSVLKVAALRKTSPGNKWENIARITCCRNS